MGKEPKHKKKNVRSKGRRPSAPDLPFPDPNLAILNKGNLIRALDEIQTRDDISSVRVGVAALREAVASGTGDPWRVLRTVLKDEPAEVVSMHKDVLLGELDQILETRTVERARHYLRRLAQGASTPENGKLNDINLFRWKEYPEVITDSLWVLAKRDTAGAHLGWYWGNFIPQIPQQMMLRYTKKGDWVVDPYLGSGTTLIECRRLGRNGIGVELSPEVAARATGLIGREEDQSAVRAEVLVGDSRTIDVPAILRDQGINQFQLLIMHPPYADIIKFSEDERDLSKAPTTESYLKMFGEVLDNFTPHLEKGRYCAVVIGDKYAKGEWIPLGSYCMSEVLKREYSLKSIIVKNFESTRGKRDQKQLWRYRALVGGFYIFKHEYIYLFKKL
jgi:hypothetical protein